MDISYLAWKKKKEKKKSNLANKSWRERIYFISTSDTTKKTVFVVHMPVFRCEISLLPV